MLKGTADIQFIQAMPKKVGADIVTVLKIKNMSTGRDFAAEGGRVLVQQEDRSCVTGDTQPYRKPFMPGEIIEITMKSPLKPDLVARPVQVLARRRAR